MTLHPDHGHWLASVLTDGDLDQVDELIWRLGCIGAAIRCSREADAAESEAARKVAADARDAYTLDAFTGRRGPEPVEGWEPPEEVQPARVGWQCEGDAEVEA